MRHPAAQQPRYDSIEELNEVTERLSMLPPVVAIGEVQKLKAQLALAAQGKAFLLQGGDCAERFQDCRSTAILNKLKILLQMSLVLTYGARLPVIRVGRIAGQFAKPRSKDTETIDGQELPSYRGDNVNDLAFTAAARRPDPLRLERGYYSSVATLNFIRALLDGGFASLHSPEHWQLDFIPAEADDGYGAYKEIADRICDAIDYLESLGSGSNGMSEIDFYTSHEGLILPYEQALTRCRRNESVFYNLSAHFIWIGERTRDLNGAHVEYFRGIKNPIGVKLGSSIQPDDLTELVEALDPGREPGRLTLITRFGAGKVEKHLPPLIQAVRMTGRKVVWSCDPMHGNTTTLSNGIKTRDFKSVVSELTSAFEVHAAQGSQLNGVHFELTGENVTECIGGAEGLDSEDLKRGYETGCDPRLNYAQSMEIALLMSTMLAQHRRRPARAPLVAPRWHFPWS
jgi:3-deoxy-7-phosphoheptulonate synthase